MHKGSVLDLESPFYVPDLITTLVVRSCAMNGAMKIIGSDGVHASVIILSCGMGPHFIIKRNSKPVSAEFSMVRLRFLIGTLNATHWVYWSGKKCWDQGLSLLSNRIFAGKGACVAVAVSRRIFNFVKKVSPLPSGIKIVSFLGQCGTHFVKLNLGRRVMLTAGMLIMVCIMLRHAPFGTIYGAFLSWKDIEVY